MGEQEYYSYIKNDGLVGVLEEHFEMLDELKEDITQKISVIRGCASKLSLKMSHKIKYIIE